MGIYPQSGGLDMPKGISVKEFEKDAHLLTEDGVLKKVPRISRSANLLIEISGLMHW